MSTPWDEHLLADASAHLPNGDDVDAAEMYLHGYDVDGGATTLHPKEACRPAPPPRSMSSTSAPVSRDGAPHYPHALDCLARSRSVLPNRNSPIALNNNPQRTPIDAKQKGRFTERVGLAGSGTVGVHAAE